MGSIWKEFTLNLPDKTQSELYGDIESVAEQETTTPLLDIRGQPFEDGWIQMLSAFIWGEGTFQLTSANNGKQFNPRFTLSLRADDGLVLKQIADRVGGTLRWVERVEGNPEVRWDICSIKDCLLLMKILNKSLPMAFKKRQAFLVWAEAVTLRMQLTKKRRKHPKCHPNARHYALDLCRVCYRRINERGDKADWRAVQSSLGHQNNQYLIEMSALRKQLMKANSFSPALVLDPRVIAEQGKKSYRSLAM